MNNYDDDQSYEQGTWDEDASYPETYEVDDYDAYDDLDLDEELSSEHNFHIAINVFDLVSTLIGLAIILLLAGLLFSLFTWVQRDISQSLFVITAPFR